ncbi:MAG: hypothetical protein ABIH77_02040 [Pseudomonadota bacterium]|nr:hypothetical protein [Gammaproteobacteria bacterium]MBU1926572.1 hypothetical protein [Gammaproteobacteria bacterium]MBU2546639.1 hypothetical protein [Gammaproteobacteria bacterium]
MKKSTLCVSIAALLMSSMCWADPTATLVNDTDYSCPGFPVNLSQCEKSVPGAEIQPVDGSMKPVGDKIAVDASGPAPIFQKSGYGAIGVLVGPFPVSLLGASEGQTYYVVTAADGGYSIAKTAP